MNRGRVVLIAGLPRAGKSTLAERLSAEHLPLDKYFLPVPAGRAFSDWVQEPTALDWEKLAQHLRILRSGRDCFTPALDWDGTGARLNDGDQTPHPRSRLVKGGAALYAVPGCFAFEMPAEAEAAFKIFVATPWQVLAERYTAGPVAANAVDQVVRTYCASCERVQAYAQAADLRCDGTALDSHVVKAVEAALLES